MAIHRSGLVKPVLVRCKNPMVVSDVTFQMGQTYELILDMGQMYVLKTETGQEVIAPKSAFAAVEEKGFKA